MIKAREDAWSHEDDLLLTEIVLTHIREGSTQLKAFEEAGDKLKRTSYACQFRWNAVVRKKKKQAVEQAKEERRNLREARTQPVVINRDIESTIVKPKITVNDIEPKEYKGLRVVTFKDIDEVHGRVEGTASRNFYHNKDRFIENEDYFAISQNDNKIRGLENIPNRGIVVLTEQGYLMLVKSLNDDIAWEVQRKLMNSYFRSKKQEIPVLPTSFAEALRLAADLEEQKQRLESRNLMLEQQVSEYQPKVTYVDTILESKDALLVSQIAEDYGLTAQELNRILHDKKIQYKMNKQWLLYSDHKGLGYTKSETYTYQKTNGEQGTKLHTKWTQKGRLFIHNILQNLGIEPLMDREEEQKRA